jgi:hypothetical protein
LKTLAWAYVTRGDHQAARPVIERALSRFDELKLGDPPAVLRIISAAAGLFARFPVLAQLFPRLVRLRHVAAQTADELNAWKARAREYLEWHSRQIDQK